MIRFFSVLWITTSFYSVTSAQDVTEPVRSVTLTIAQLKSFGYSGTINQSAQPISSKVDALNFIKNISNTNDPNLATIKGDIDVFTRKLDERDNDKYAIILIKHPLDLNKLFAENTATQTTLSTKFGTFDARKTTLTNLLTSINARTKQIEDNTRATPGDVSTAFVPGSLSAATVQELNNIKVLRQNTMDELAVIEKELSDIKADFVNVSSEIVEDQKIESMVLDYNDQEWSDYLLNVDRILYVLVGGPEDIQKGELKIDNKPSSFQTSLQQAAQVASALGIPVPIGASIPGLQLRDKIKVTFLLIRRKKIKAPATLEYKMPKDEKIAVDIHEKANFGLKFGFSASYVTRKNFTIDPQNELTIDIDDNKKTELKSNLIALLEVIPWGRDIDRLEPIFSKNKDIKFFDINRLGFVFGVKLSKDPLEGLYGGLSYSLSKTVALNFGISFRQTPKEVTDLPVGINASLDYLEENAEKELKSQLFFGISFSPLFLGKSLGIVK